MASFDYHQHALALQGQAVAQGHRRCRCAHDAFEAGFTSRLLPKSRRRPSVICPSQS
jgi:hypothetical protein